MNSLLFFPPEQIILVILALAIAFSVHEASHAYSAYKFGDHTAASMGRLTLNPAKHLDPMGTIALLLFGFGWAKPVPVNTRNLKNPKVANIVISAAGPLSNFLLAVLGGFSISILLQTGLISTTFGGTLVDFLSIFISINITLFIFNLLPFPPLDGFRIVEEFLPTSIRFKIRAYEMYVYILFLFLLLSPLNSVTIGVIFDVFIPMTTTLIKNITFLS